MRTGDAGRYVRPGPLRGAARCAATVLLILGLAFTLVASGCVDFVDVTHAGPATAVRFEVTVHLVEDSAFCDGACRFPDGSPVPPGPGGGVAWVTAQLDPGFDAGGLPRRLLDTTLVVAGTVVPWTGTDGDVWRFHGTLPISLDTLDRVRVSVDPPAVERALGTPPALTWFVPATAGPDTVIVQSGEDDVVLRLRPPAAGPEPPFGFQSWTLQLQGDPAVQVSSTGPVPLELHVPVYYLAFPGPTLAARLEILAGAGFVPAPGDFATTVIIDAVLGWTLRAPDAPATTAARAGASAPAGA